MTSHAAGILPLRMDEEYTRCRLIMNGLTTDRGWLLACVSNVLLAMPSVMLSRSG
ncbi:MAG: hypothetical protein ISQ21_05070 [Alphaproteobacteria bacterium]|nr:hypothetical protein [Alphaproteobacteria bacterium]